MISQEEKKDIIQRIKESNQFVRSETSKRLIDYIFSAHLNEENIKALQIANDFFNRDGHVQDGDETIVRVYIHKLRKKLEEFYLKQGKEEKIIVEIPKGNYDFHFRIRGEDDKEEGGIVRRTYSFMQMILAIIGMGILCLILFFVVGVFESNKVNSIWKDYYKDGNDVRVVLGSPYFYSLINDENGHTVIIRDYYLNSEEDIQNSDYVLDINGYRVSKNYNQYYSANAVYPLPKILNILYGTKNRIILRSRDETSMNDLKTSNMICISSIKDLGQFYKFLENTSFQISFAGKLPALELLSGKDTVSYSPPRSEFTYYIDYALMVKLPSNNNENIISILTDNHSIGNQGLVDLLSREDVESVIMDKFPQPDNKFPKYFEILVKASGYHLDNISTEIVHFKALEGYN